MIFYMNRISNIFSLLSYTCYNAISFLNGWTLFQSRQYPQPGFGHKFWLYYKFINLIS